MKSGSEGAVWSEVYQFRAPYSSGPTQVAIYGDMGNDKGNNMENLRAGCQSGLIDAVVHMGE